MCLLLHYNRIKFIHLKMSKAKIVEEILGKYYNSGDEMLFHCPRCNHHKPKMSVNIDKDVFKCWVCDYSGTSIYRLVRMQLQLLIGHTQLVHSFGKSYQVLFSFPILKKRLNLCLRALRNQMRFIERLCQRALYP